VTIAGGPWHTGCMAEKNVPGGFLGAGGMQIPSVVPTTKSLAATYAVGTEPANQTMALTDARGGTVVLDGAGLTGAYPYTLSVLGNQFLGRSLAVGVDVGVMPTARIHVSGGSLNAGSASLKLDQGFLMTVAEPGAIESDGADLWWTDGTSTRRKLNVQTLADAYGRGGNAAAQTLILTNARGGALVINGTTPGPAFTGVTSFEVNVNAGSTNFYTKGGFDVSSIIPVAAAAGANWDSVNFLASTLTLTGGPTTVTKVAMVHVGAATINGAGNTVSDSYNLLIDTAPAGTAALTRAWSLGTVGKAQFGGNISIPDGAVATPAINFSTDPTCGFYHTGTGATGLLSVGINSTQAITITPAITRFYTTVVAGTAAAGLAYLQLGPTANLMFEMPSYSNSSLSVSQNAWFDGSWHYSISDKASNYYQSAGTHNWRIAPSGIAGNVITWITAMSIDSAGNVGIGGLNPGASNQLLVRANKSVVSNPASDWNGIWFISSTLTLTGAVTPVTALSFTTIGIPTITSASAITVAAAATLTIAGAPTVAGSTTITNAYALWIKAGSVRVASLAGVGTRAVVADANGVLSAP
jgi:hypothetical protein